MSFIVTFLGKGGTGRSTVAIAAAHQSAGQGQRVLLVSQDPSPAFEMLLGQTVGMEPSAIAPNLSVVQLQTAQLLEQSWDELKRQEAQYLRTPFFKAVYGQELGVLPGMDTALALNALREYDASGNYDVIVYDGTGDLTTLRMLGMPEILSWYLRRFRQVFAESDLGKSLSPFIQPVASTVLNVDWNGDLFSSPPAGQVNNFLDAGRKAVSEPTRVAAYLVTTAAADAIATARYLWGSAQQIGLTVGGVLLNQGDRAAIAPQFEPLVVSSIPNQTAGDWTAIAAALPDLKQAMLAPKPITIDERDRTVKLFLPSFSKKQVKLTQYGPEVTIEAGDQRRNILLPPSLQGKPVTGAKFQDSYLMISF
jgi:anion-transporting  ArsA/GET3 family ATPase